MAEPRNRHIRIDKHRNAKAIALVLDRIFPQSDVARAQKVITGWAGYHPTPLRDLSQIASKLGIGHIAYKDESDRFGLGSFKALGGAYAVEQVIRRHLGIENLTEPISRGDAHKFTVTSATAGNHGRAVAWGARRVGCRCVILVHAGVPQDRRAAIAEFGAEVREVAGTYDDSVNQAFSLGAENGWTVVSDTSRPGYEDIPSLVMQGYTVMVEEAVRQWGEGEAPTHIIVQVGVGGLAAAVFSSVWRYWGARVPRFVCVEPASADCLFQSLQHGRMTSAIGNLDTMMVCLACGELSCLAWDILSTGVTDAVRVWDTEGVAAMRLLAENGASSGSIVAGESGAASLAVLKAAADEPAFAAQLDLSTESRVLLFGTEGALDVGLFERAVGRRPGSEGIS